MSEVLMADTEKISDQISRAYSLKDQRLILYREFGNIKLRQLFDSVQKNSARLSIV